MRNFVIYLFIIALLLGCKDEKTRPEEIGTILVINAITGAGAVKVNPTGKSKAWSSFVLQTAYPAGTLYYATTGNANFTIVPVSDTTRILFNRSFSLKAKMYTLYLSGTSAATDTMLREEVNYPNIITAGSNIPSSADSIVNVRFVNLSANSPNLKVRLSTVTTNEVDNLPYKSITAFKAYPARLASTVYSFQIRRADTDALITTFNFSATSANRFKNVVLVMRGVFGTTTGTAPFGITTINYF
ncbi:DUF4397 domain-containing protein [Pedobacter heparinus]|uniref:DUF4397 domain-containing protein n=1 Tax=Pedobacter heparinus (strain ATCC 13125 / DSM 2366 / CIP 104194 / JCM 7457 / NBRC 12017 / NCIMB 9290 / NRRL B-14731 / HIM 762-3) TaxID=485917 RepID=C6Y2R8_PEDHD|nr:DUF4397 domain-containing protein [Pedobacter heparinus]ACU03131.1 hypothetical protein Phep_0909 [Pedobacter heparinus DSM 2366]